MCPLLMRDMWQGMPSALTVQLMPAVVPLLQICIFGVTTTYVPDNMMGPVRITDPLSAANEAVNKMRQAESCHAVLLLSHLG